MTLLPNYSDTTQDITYNRFFVLVERSRWCIGQVINIANLLVECTPLMPPQRRMETTWRKKSTWIRARTRRIEGKR